MRKTGIIAAIAALCWAGQVSAETLIMGNEGDYPPFSITNADGSLTGLEPDLARALCERLKAECTIQAMDFKALIPSLVTGKINMIVSQLFPNEERRAAVEMTNPVLENPETWIAPTGTAKEITPDFLNGKSVGIIKGSWNLPLIEKYAPGAVLKQYDNLPAIKLDLEAGRVDLGTAGTLAAVRNFIDQPDGSKWELITPDKELVGEATFNWAVQKGNVELRDRVNKALKEMFADCTYTKIRKKYISVPSSSQEPASCQ